MCGGYPVLTGPLLWLDMSTCRKRRFELVVPIVMSAASTSARGALYHDIGTAIPVSSRSLREVPASPGVRSQTSFHNVQNHGGQADRLAP